MSSPRLLLPDREVWTARPTPNQQRPPGRERVILVPPGFDLALGFEALRKEAACTKQLIRLVGRGSTLRSTWPKWLAGCQASVALTEIDAYLPCDKAPLVGEVITGVRTWLSSVLKDAIEDLDVADAFWASAMHRAVWPALNAWPLVVGLAEHHRADDLLCLDPDWAGLQALRELVESAGGSIAVPRPTPSRHLWRLELLARTAAAMLASAAFRTMEFLRERPSRRQLKTLRRSTASPRLWIGLIGDWPRSSRHVLDLLATSPSLCAGGIGVLLQSTLQPGLRREDDMHGRTPGRPFPALDHPTLRECTVAIEQVAATESAADLAFHCLSTAAWSLHAATRLALGERRPRLGPLSFDLTRELNGLSRLLTIDVLRARESQRATRLLTRRRSFAGAHVVWPHASLANVAVPDLLLQRSGATTYDLVHGALAESLDMLTHARTNSSVKLLWTEAEVEYLRPYTQHQATIGGILPRSMPMSGVRPPVRGRAVQLLALTNYATPTTGVEGVLPRLRYQHAFFEAIAAVQARSPVPLTIRWRPHPGDRRDCVFQTKEQHPTLRLELSLGEQSLSEDLSWSDIVVSSLSTVVVEALCYPVPIFIHDIPIHESKVLLSLFEPVRRFRTPHELAQAISGCLVDLHNGSSQLLLPEEAVRTRFFGPSGKHREFSSLLVGTQVFAA